MKVPMAAAAPKKSSILWMLRSSLLATALKYAAILKTGHGIDTGYRKVWLSSRGEFSCLDDAVS